MPQKGDRRRGKPLNPDLGYSGDPVHHASTSVPRRIGIRELRQHASVYVDLVGARDRGRRRRAGRRGRQRARRRPVPGVARAGRPGHQAQRERAAAPGARGRGRGTVLIYLDSSALVKLALTEPESQALASWLAERADQSLVSSALHRAEVLRAIWLAEPGAIPRRPRIIRRIGRVALSNDVLETAATLPPAGLGTAGAIHLASALAIRRDLVSFVAYDKPLLEAAREAGIPVDSPS